MSQWTDICSVDDLTPDTGVCALLPGEKSDEQVAIFLERLSGQLFAVSNFDPCGNAYVMSRGLIGSIGGDLVVASPLYKQHFKLATGECLEESDKCLKTYAVRENSGRVELAQAA